MNQVYFLKRVKLSGYWWSTAIIVIVIIIEIIIIITTVLSQENKAELVNSLTSFSGAALPSEE